MIGVKFVVFFSIIGIIFPYLIYPVIIYLFSKRKARRKNENEIDFQPDVSIFIAAYNEEKVIKSKLENCLSLNYPQTKLEIIVASDGSNDRTNEYVKSYADKYENIRLLELSDRKGKVNVLNRGLEKCENNIIILSDANAMYNKEAVKKIVKHFAIESVGCVSGEKRIGDFKEGVGEKEGFYWKFESFLKQHESLYRTAIGADGALYAIRKNLFKKLPEDTAVDDFLLSVRIIEQGYKIVYEPEAYSVEETGETLKKEFQRKVRISAGNFFNLRYLMWILGMNKICFMFFSHKFLRWISPFLFLFATIGSAFLGEILIFRMFFVFILSTYVVALIGFFVEEYGKKKMKYLGFLTYFYMTVLAQFVGFIKFMRGSQKSIWDTIR